MSNDRSRPRWRGKIILCLAVLCVVSIITQVLWPGKKFMAFTKIGGVEVAGLDFAEAREQASEIFTDHQLVVETDDGTTIVTVPVPIEQIAIDAMLASALEYPLWQRLIPFSSFTRAFSSNWTGAETNLDVDSIVASISETPVDAHIAVEDTVTTITEAQSGFELDREELANRLRELRLGAEGRTVVQIAAKVTPPDVTTDSISGLQSSDPAQLYPELLKTFHGKEFSVAASSLDEIWDISISAGDAWTSASTYKLFIAYYMLKKVESGELSYSSIESCMQRMIIDSDNACPESWLVKYGYSDINAVIQEINGLKSTQIANGNMQTSAGDLATFLRSLYQRKLLSEESTDHLLELMKVQKYRNGVPAGVNEKPVADKVGFLWGLLHDAAIVFSETGDYTLVIMTDGSTWSNIAEIAKVIDAFSSSQ